MSKIRAILFTTFNVLFLSEITLAAVTTCYLSSGSTSPCNGVSCTTKQTCNAGTGTDLCFVGKKTSDGKWYQGCGSSSMSFTAYGSNHASCSSNDCNNANGLKCYINTALSSPSSSNPSFCIGSDDICYFGIRTSDGTWDQDCGSSSMSFTAYGSNYGTCSTDFCNNVNGLTCYESTASTRPVNTNPVYCTGGNIYCYAALDSNNKYNQGCGSFSYVYSAFPTAKLCSSNNCNSAALGCYSCNGCSSSSSSDKTVCSSPDDAICYVAYKSDGNYDMGCAASTTGLTGYNRTTSCATDLCNLVFDPWYTTTRLYITIKNNSNQHRSSMSLAQSILISVIACTLIIFFSKF